MKLLSQTVTGNSTFNMAHCVTCQIASYPYVAMGTLTKPSLCGRVVLGGLAGKQGGHWDDVVGYKES